MLSPYPIKYPIIPYASACQRELWRRGTHCDRASEAASLSIESLPLRLATQKLRYARWDDCIRLRLKAFPVLRRLREFHFKPVHRIDRFLWDDFDIAGPRDFDIAVPQNLADCEVVGAESTDVRCQPTTKCVITEPLDSRLLQRRRDDITKNVCRGK